MNYQYLIITGCFRSGTSILVDILNRDPNIFIMDESWYFSNDKVVEAEFFNKINRLCNNKLMSEERPIIKETKVADYSIFKNLNNKKELEDRIISFNPKLKYFGDKFPEYIFEIRAINKYYSPKVIVCIRDPRDIICSQLMNYKRLMKLYGSRNQHWWARESIQECINLVSWFDFLSNWEQNKADLDYYELNYLNVSQNISSECTKLADYLKVCPAILYSSFCELFKPKNNVWQELYPDINNYLPNSWKDLMVKYGFSL